MFFRTSLVIYFCDFLFGTSIDFLTQSLNSTSDLHNSYRELDFPEQPPEGLNPDYRQKAVRIMTMGHADSASQYINLPSMSRNILGLMARLLWSFSPFFVRC
jgi:hypothetical protein